jgi:flavorubredoxin
MDDKITLVDTVFGPFGNEMLEKIAEITNPAKIDYVIANHVETDHSGAIPEIMRIAPNATVIGTARCREGLQKHYFGNWNFQVVKTGDEISLGSKTLKFIEAPMLHWPDSMFTYVPEDSLLLPNDAFGQHLATSRRFNDEVDQAILMEEAAKYYANILWPLSAMVARKIEEISKMGLPIRMIAPSHGVIWRDRPLQIVEAYLRWAKGEARKRILVVYDTMWGSTEKMAKMIMKGIISEGVETSLFRLPYSDRGDIFKELLDAECLVIGSSTINNSILPTVSPFLDELVGLKPVNKTAAAFGSFGWGGGAVKTIEDSIAKAGIRNIVPSLAVKWAPDTLELQKCFEFGKEIAQKIQSNE